MRRLRAHARCAGLRVPGEGAGARACPPPAAPLPPLADRASAPRDRIAAADAGVEALLAALCEEGAAAGEGFATAELISSEGFVAQVDAAITKHARVAAAERAGQDAIGDATEVLRALQRPTPANNDSEHLPGLTAAAKTAASLLATAGEKVANAKRAAFGRSSQPTLNGDSDSLHRRDKG